MQATDLLIFRNYSGIEEPAISSPFGSLSIRNIMVLAIFGGISLGLHKTIMPDSIEFPRDVILLGIVLVPLLFGLAMAMIKPQFGTMDSILLSFFIMSQNKKKQKIKIKTEKTKKKSSVLQFPKNIKKEKVMLADIVQELVCTDLDDLKSLKFQISYPDGGYVSNKLVRCYIDDEKIDTIKTTFNGLVVIKIRPESIGKKILVIRDDDKVILKRTILVKKK